ncbi:MAG: hypothetical protein WBK76_00415 [Candidatus Saccharimonadales bacterium]
MGENQCYNGAGKQGDKNMMTFKKLISTWVIMVVIAIIINAVILAGAVWLVIKVLQWTGVM